MLSNSAVRHRFAVERHRPWMDREGGVKPQLPCRRRLARGHLSRLREKELPAAITFWVSDTPNLFLPPQRRSRKSAKSCSASLWSMALAVKQSDSAECRQSQER